MTDQPDVSVIIAAYRAQDFVRTAIESATAQDASLEILVAPDEPDDYRFLLARDPRIRVLEPVAAPTGPAAARNRALRVARGHFIALLDADDYWSPSYLSTLLPLAARHGAAFGRTMIADWDGTELRSVPAHDDRDVVDFATFATAYGSLHGIARREATRSWQDLLAEDVLYDLESLALAGGRAPYAAGAVYTLRVRLQSFSHSEDFIRDIDAGYARLIGLIQNGMTAVPAPLRDSASD
ncbi:MAG: glycosyltransferase family 2 protein, partial [Dongiaceae bacterium]